MQGWNLDYLHIILLQPNYEALKSIEQQFKDRGLQEEFRRLVTRRSQRKNPFDKQLDGFQAKHYLEFFGGLKIYENKHSEYTESMRLLRR